MQIQCSRNWDSCFNGVDILGFGITCVSLGHVSLLKSVSPMVSVSCVNVAFMDVRVFAV